MADEKSKEQQEQPKAANAGWSVYQVHKNWAQMEAERLTKQRGRPVSASEVVREALDKIIRKGK